MLEHEGAIVRWIIRLQVAIPAGLLLARYVVGEVVGYGFGWQMFG